MNLFQKCSIIRFTSGCKRNISMMEHKVDLSISCWFATTKKLCKKFDSSGTHAVKLTLQNAQWYAIYWACMKNRFRWQVSFLYGKQSNLAPETLKGSKASFHQNEIYILSQRPIARPSQRVSSRHIGAKLCMVGLILLVFILCSMMSLTPRLFHS